MPYTTSSMYKLSWPRRLALRNSILDFHQMHQNPRCVERSCHRIGDATRGSQHDQNHPAWREECQDAMKSVNMLSLTPNQYLRFWNDGCGIQSSFIAWCVEGGHSMLLPTILARRSTASWSMRDICQAMPVDFNINTTNGTMEKPEYQARPPHPLDGYLDKKCKKALYSLYTTIKIKVTLPPFAEGWNKLRWPCTKCMNVWQCNKKSKLRAVQAPSQDQSVSCHVAGLYLFHKKVVHPNLQKIFEQIRGSDPDPRLTKLVHCVGFSICKPSDRDDLGNNHPKNIEHLRVGQLFSHSTHSTHSKKALPFRLLALWPTDVVRQWLQSKMIKAILDSLHPIACPWPAPVHPIWSIPSEVCADACKKT